MRLRLELIVAIGISHWVLASCGDGDEVASASTSNGTGSTNPSSATGATDASATQSDASEATSSTDGGGLSPTAACEAYLACAAATVPSELGALLDAYGPEGSCWQSTQDVADQCDMACEVGLGQLQETYSDESACGGSGDTTPADIDYAMHIQPIFDANCTTGCHQLGGIEGSNTVHLTADASHATLTTQKPVYSTEQTFVVAGSAADSFLIDALRHPPGTIVRQMPLLLDTSSEPPVGIQGAAPLPEAEIALIEAWIDAGANP